MPSSYEKWTEVDGGRREADGYIEVRIDTCGHTVRARDCNQEEGTGGGSGFHELGGKRKMIRILQEKNEEEAPALVRTTGGDKHTGVSGEVDVV